MPQASGGPEADQDCSGGERDLNGTQFDLKNSREFRKDMRRKARQILFRDPSPARVIRGICAMVPVLD